MSNTGLPRTTRPSPQNLPRSRLSSQESVDETVELLTGFTPRQLESINRLVCARVDHALIQNTPASPTPLRGFTARRSLTGQRSLHDLISTRRNERLHGRDKHESAVTDGALDSNEQSPNASQFFGNEPQTTIVDSQPTQTLNSMPSSATLMNRPDINDHPALRHQNLAHSHTVAGLSVRDFQPDPTSSRSSIPRIVRTDVILPESAPSSSNTVRFAENEHEVRYLALHPHLPPNTPLTHPHIVDLATVDELVPQKGLGIADLVVTVLYEYDTQALNKFLNVSKKAFIFRRHPPSSAAKAHFIERENKFVSVGTYSTDGKSVEESITYRIIDDATGAWSPLSIRGPRSGTLRGARAIDDYVRRDFTKAILAQKPWEKGDGVKFVVKCK